MFWVIRWADGDEDKAVVIEAESRAAAECAALKRSIPVVFVGEADADDLRDARRGGFLWKHTRDPKHTCLGRPVGRLQLTCLMFAGAATLLLHVHRACPFTSVFSNVRHWIA